MVDFLTASTAISAAQDARTVIRTGGLGGAQRVGAVELDDALKPGIFTEVRNVLSNAEGRTGLALAVVAGNGIVGALKALASSAKLAQKESLVSNLVNLEISGTRISRLNLDVDTSRALTLIDGLVAETELNNANFIGSNASPIVITTSKFGGAIKVTPQPLDTKGLNLQSISLLSLRDAEDAEARILSAINTAQRRLLGLEGLQRALNTGDFTSSRLDNLVSTISGSGLPLGTLVNVVG